MNKRLLLCAPVLLTVFACTDAEINQFRERLKAGTLPSDLIAVASALATPAPSATPSVLPTPGPTPSPVPTPGPTPPPPSPTPLPTGVGTPGPVGTPPPTLPFLFPPSPPNPTWTAGPTPGATGLPTAYPSLDPATFFARPILHAPYQGPITLTIDPSLAVSLPGAVPSAAITYRITGASTVATTSWQLQAASDAQSQALDIGNPQSLAGLDPGLGEVSYGAGRGMGVMSLSMPNSPSMAPAIMASGYLAVYPKSAAALATLVNLVGGTVASSIGSDFRMIQVTPATADLARLPGYLRLMSQYTSEPITSVSFSSIKLAQTFTLWLMLTVDRSDLAWAASMDSVAPLPTALP